jgi:4'-phosphopantetheinyl transferase
LSALLSDDERARANRFMFDRDKAEFTAVRGALRQLLGAYTGRPPAQIEFAYSAEGKPSLKANDQSPSFFFNVSHSHGQALLAFATDRDVGADVEQHDAHTDVRELSGATMSADEQQALAALAADAQRSMFYRLWSCKEAYIKAVGDGLSIPLRDFTVEITAGGPRWNIRHPATAPALFAVQDVPVPHGYSAAVAARGHDWRRHVFDLRFG